MRNNVHENVNSPHVSCYERTRDSITYMQHVRKDTKEQLCVRASSIDARNLCQRNKPICSESRQDTSTYSGDQNTNLACVL